LATDLLTGGAAPAPGGGLGAGRADADMVDVYRFHTATDPSTLRSPLAREDAATQAAERAQWDTPELLAQRARLHMEGYTDYSPFVSLTTDPNAAANSPDDWLRTIATGEPGFPNTQRAPDLSTFRVPRSRLIQPDADNELSLLEGEVLWHGEDLADFRVNTKPNPYHPSEPP
jgi:hypothetical protein